MNSVALKWFANGMIALVVTSTLWLAGNLRHEHVGRSLQLAHAAMAASAPTQSR